MMKDIIFNYIIQAFLGGASGYITNDYAINMLFKEYTPLKIGGVIKKTRNEFIDNLSNIIENDIISKDKINEILHDEKFNAKFEALTNDFFTIFLYDSIENNSISDIRGIDSTIQKTGEFLENNITKFLSELIYFFIDNINIEEVFTEEQLTKITNSIISSITSMIENSDFVDEVLNNLYNEISHIKIANILGNLEKSKKNIVSNILYELENIVNNNNINDKILNIYKTTEVNKALVAGKEIFYNKKIKDIINLSEEEKIKLSQLFVDFINSHKGQNILYEMSNSLFLYGEKCDKSIFQILDANFEKSLKLYLLENIPILTEKLIEWLNENNNNIDKIINNSIDEVIEESDGLKGKLLSTIKDSYFNNLSSKYNIVQKVIDYVKSISEPEMLSSSISAKIINLLNNLSIKEIVAEAENNSIDSIKTTIFITNYINSHFEVVFNQLLYYILESQVKDFLPKELLSKKTITNLITKSKKIISSNYFHNNIENKVNIYLSNITNKSVGDLLNEEKFKNNIHEIKNIFITQLNENSSEIKKLIKNNIIKIDFNKKLDNPVIHELLINNINKKYHSESNKIKEKNMSLLIDKLNSIDNLNKNSTKALQNYIINNMDKILEGSVKNIVAENLNKLNDDELVDFANDFIGRELKPIMYFGGILGVVAGIILAAFQNVPLNPGHINIINMITYALVGFSTNAIAINMIFKPYKEKKILSKLPFLKNFSLGYIIKNQKIFAKNTAFYIENNLLSKKSINELFIKNEQKIRSSLTSSISANNYEVLNKLLVNNKNNIINKTYMFTRDLILNNQNSIGNFTYNEISNIKLSSLLTDSNISNLSAISTDLLLDNQKKIGNLLYSNSISYLDSSKFKNKINISVSKKFNKHYNKTYEFLDNPMKIKNSLLKYNNKYQAYINRPLSEIISTETNEELILIVNNKIHEILISENYRENITNVIIKLFNNYFQKNKNFEDLFEGKLKNYINSKVPMLLDKLSLSIKNNVITKKDSISTKVKIEIKNHLGVLEKGMYSLIGGDELIDKLMNKIIVNKIPEFMDDKENEVLHIVYNLLNDKLYKSKVDNLHNFLNKIQIKSIIDNYLSDLDNVKNIEDKLKLIIKETVFKIEKVNLNSLLKFMSLNDINNTFTLYKDELKVIFSYLSESLKNNKEEIIAAVDRTTNFIVEEFYKSCSFKKIFKDVTEEDINIIVNNLIIILNKNDNLQNSFSFLIKEYKEYVSQNNLSEFIDKDEFMKSTELFVMKLLNNPKTEIHLKNFYSSLLNESTNCNFSFIDEKTKSYFLNIFVNSSINSVRNNIDELLKSIELDKIAREEIENMEPKKIHEMFNSFADKYFKKLMLYGLGGFVFGINMYVGFTVTILKVIGGKFKM
ncbi:DUF445 family protein [Sedimentibacter sp. MB31-C6]|uniref:DUF445 family protein n=1 Tax=Sedimentibacter sp. MB31-C6 TaxID=3109366 RepID=UPI002DDD67DD|nr:DUF445 family protein [Sedimentibacter sp. MB36-C1]WSI03323.1 DUF445 family protein [Sedimentibacter sp. MB36-C1]